MASRKQWAIIVALIAIWTVQAIRGDPNATGGYVMGNIIGGMLLFGGLTWAYNRHVPKGESQ